MMSGIRSSNTRPERIIRSALHRHGYRFHLGSKVGKIKPDIVLRSRKIAVFVHGCFWHQHKGCKLAYSDRLYSTEWKNKFQSNKGRDDRVLKQLLSEHWRVAIVWECATRSPEACDELILDLCDWIENSTNSTFESTFVRS